MMRPLVLSLAVLGTVFARAIPPTPLGPGQPQIVEDADTTARNAYSGELSYLAPVHGSLSGDSPLGLAFAYGLTGHTELGLGLGALSGEPRYRRSEQDEFGDLALSAKTRFFESKDVAIALAYQSTLLLADRNRSRDFADQSVYLVASKTLGKLELVGNAGATAPGSTLQRTVPLAGASAVYDLHRATSVLLQINENLPQVAGLRDKLELAAGVTHGLGSGFEVQALVGRSGRGDRNNGLFLGGSYRFGGGR